MDFRYRLVGEVSGILMAAWVAAGSDKRGALSASVRNVRLCLDLKIVTAGRKALIFREITEKKIHVFNGK